ncbi:hypothetical protein SeLEV6574_g05218 [Synchytrium endobioticum]|uniref:Uncharacterized protein n=1 Tax=Synchytrium endobioticum TaxID=286115 RepID=A0A507CW98_9FUNG|nr:hypothetical protein SeLEV6574_g05218 [Synchytrium endobioticum]
MGTRDKILLLLCAVGALLLGSSSAYISDSIKDVATDVLLPPHHRAAGSMVEAKSLTKRSLSGLSVNDLIDNIFCNQYDFTHVEHLFGLSIPLTLAGVAILILLHPSVGFYIATMGIAVITIATALYAAKIVFNIFTMLKNRFWKKAGLKKKPQGSCCQGKKEKATSDPDNSPPGGNNGDPGTCGGLDESDAQYDNGRLGDSFKSMDPGPSNRGVSSPTMNAGLSRSPLDRVDSMKFSSYTPTAGPTGNDAPSSPRPHILISFITSGEMSRVTYPEVDTSPVHIPSIYSEVVAVGVPARHEAKIPTLPTAHRPYKTSSTNGVILSGSRNVLAAVSSVTMVVGLGFILANALPAVSGVVVTVGAVGLALVVASGVQEWYKGWKLARKQRYYNNIGQPPAAGPNSRPRSIPPVKPYRGPGGPDSRRFLPSAPPMPAFRGRRKR